MCIRDSPVKELAAFAKTGLLAPGEEEELFLQFPVNAMAAYDDGGYTGNKDVYKRQGHKRCPPDFRRKRLSERHGSGTGIQGCQNHHHL